MDKAVSNAGPLIHLAEIGEFELLKIFSQIYIPDRVYEEVCIEDQPGEREVRNAENMEVLSVSKEEIGEIPKFQSINNHRLSINKLCQYFH